MIESPPFSSNINRLHLDQLSLSELVEQIEDTSYQKGDSYGFTVEEVEPTLVSAYLLLTRPEVRQMYDEESQSVVDKEIKTVEMIPFRIDTEYGVLEVLADQKKASNVSNKLGQLTDWGISVEDISFSPKNLLDNIRIDYQTEITSVKISDYQISSSVTGDFQVSVADQSVGQDLVREYQGQISYLGARIGGTDSVTIGIYESGSIMVYNNLGDYSSVLDTAKEVSVGSMEAK